MGQNEYRQFRAVRVAIGIVFCGAALAGQTPQFRGHVDAVRLEVSVLDSKRQPVHGLRAEDFQVLDNGKPQQMLTFEEVLLQPSVGLSSSWMREVSSDVASNQSAVRRRLVILLDDGFTGYGLGEPRLVRLVANAVIDRLEPTDLAAVVFTHLGRSQEFTADRTRLRLAVDSFVPRNAGAGGIPLGCQLRVESCAGNALIRIAEVLGLGEGPRIVVFISPSARFTSLPAPVARGPQDRVTLETILEALRESNVRVYPFDPRGLIPRRDARLDELAERTGGKTIAQTNEPERYVSHVFEENQSYYILGYRPPDNPAGGRLRPIRVQVRERPDLIVSTKSAYRTPRERSGPAAVSEPPRLDDAIARGLPTGDLSLRSLASVVPRHKQRGGDVIVQAEVREDATTGNSQEPVERVVTVAAAAFDGGWTERASVRERATIALAPRGPRVVYTVATRLSLAPGRYQVRLAVEADGKTGSVFLDVNVPSFTDEVLSLSNPILAVKDPAPIVGKPGVMNGLPVSPSLVREFGRGDSLSAVGLVHQRQDRPFKPAVLQLLVKNGRDEQVIKQDIELPATRFGAAGAEGRFTIPLERLDSGEYLLTIKATVPELEVERHLRFSVR